MSVKPSLDDADDEAPVPWTSTARPTPSKQRQHELPPRAAGTATHRNEDADDRRRAARPSPAGAAPNAPRRRGAAVEVNGTVAQHEHGQGEPGGDGRTGAPMPATSSARTGPDVRRRRLVLQRRRLIFVPFRHVGRVARDPYLTVRSSTTRSSTRAGAARRLRPGVSRGRPLALPTARRRVRTTASAAAAAKAAATNAGTTHRESGGFGSVGPSDVEAPDRQLRRSQRGPSRRANVDHRDDHGNRRPGPGPGVARRRRLVVQRRRLLGVAHAADSTTDASLSRVATRPSSGFGNVVRPGPGPRCDPA